MKPFPKPPVLTDLYDQGAVVGEYMMAPPPSKTACKHGVGECELCGTTDKRDVKHTTVSGRGKIARMKGKRK